MSGIVYCQCPAVEFLLVLKTRAPNRCPLVLEASSNVFLPTILLVRPRCGLLD